MALYENCPRSNAISCLVFTFSSTFDIRVTLTPGITSSWQEKVLESHEPSERCLKKWNMGESIIRRFRRSTTLQKQRMSTQAVPRTYLNWHRINGVKIDNRDELSACIINTTPVAAYVFSGGSICVLVHWMLVTLRLKWNEGFSFIGVYGLSRCHCSLNF